METAERWTEIQYTKEDFVAAYQLSAKPTRLGWLMLLLAPIIGSTVAVFLNPSPGVVRWTVIWIATLSGVLIFLAINSAILIPWRIGRSHTRYPLAHLPHRFSLGQDSLSFQSARGESALQWKDFIRWRADRLTILLYQSPHVFIILPTRLAALGFPINDLKAALTRELGTPR